jgi:class 3 adenylate cyclase
MLDDGASRGPNWPLQVALGLRVSDLTDVTRRLVAVLAADVEGYSRLMGTDEVGTFKGLTERRAILAKFIFGLQGPHSEHGGR